MGEYFDVIIIGGGIAGLCAGAYIAREGNSVLVCEQADQIGGYFRSFSKGGFIFDTGLKAVENAGILIPMLRQLGLEDRAGLIKSTSAIGLPDQFVPLHTSEDINNFFSILASHFPDERNGLKELFRQSEKINAWINIMTTMPNPLFEEPKQMAARLFPWLGGNLPALIRFRQTQKLLEIPMVDFLKRYIVNKELIALMTELFFRGTPALFGLGYSKLFLDYYYPCKGMQSLTDIIAEYLKEKGGIIRTRSRVRRITIENNAVTGIQLDDGVEIRSKYIIATSDMRTVYLEMIESQYLQPGFRDRIKEAEIGESAVCVFLATDLPAAELPVQGCSHIYHLPDYQGVGTSDRMEADYFKRTPLEISIPCLNNPSLAPPGKSGIIISALAESKFADNWGTKNGEPTPAYNELKEQVGDQLVEVASQIIPNLKDHIIFRDIATPHTYRRYTFNSDGSICGWTYDRRTTLHRKGTGGMQTCMLSPIEGLLQAGHWTVYPGGAPVSVLSARMAAGYIAKRNKKRKQGK